MLTESLKQKIASRAFWNVEKPEDILPPKMLEREDYLNKLFELSNINMVVATLGIRRGGKSVLVKQFIQKLRRNQISSTNILYLNFFLRVIQEAKQENVFHQVIEWWINEISSNEQKRYLILDEVQEIENWDVNIGSIYEDHAINCQIIITGSNSNLLNNRLDTSLGGRYTILNVYPFSFTEYCTFTNSEHNTETVVNYLTKGGMAEPLKIDTEEIRERVIQDIINSTIERDIIQRQDISNPKLLNNLVEYCRLMFAKEVSVSSIEKQLLTSLKGQKHSSLVGDYLDYIQDAFFISLPNTYSYRIKDVLKSKISKLYLADMSFALYHSGTEKGRLLENMVYNELLKSDYKVKRFFGYKNKNIEIDFLAEKQGKAMLVQVAWLLGDSSENVELWQREFGNLESTKYAAPKYVVSLDEKVESPYPTITHLNIVEFLKLIRSSD